ncbi:MAG: hypothetical protein ACPGSG_10445 [Prolixibacteraceae bacterium]
MRSIKKIYFLLIILGLASCSKELEQNAFIDIPKESRGYYMIVGAINNTPIDLNNDGIESKDIMGQILHSEAHYPIYDESLIAELANDYFKVGFPRQHLFDTEGKSKCDRSRTWYYYCKFQTFKNTDTQSTIEATGRRVYANYLLTEQKPSSSNEGSWEIFEYHNDTLKARLNSFAYDFKSKHLKYLETVVTFKKVSTNNMSEAVENAKKTSLITSKAYPVNHN